MSSRSIKPIISEKTAQLINSNKYVFYISCNENKIEIKKYIEEYFKVKVEKINILNVKGKKVRRGVIRGQKSDRKKAVVTLKENETIESVKRLF